MRERPQVRVLLLPAGPELGALQRALAGGQSDGHVQNQRPSVRRADKRPSSWRSAEHAMGLWQRRHHDRVSVPETKWPGQLLCKDRDEWAIPFTGAEAAQRNCREGQVVQTVVFL